MVREKWINTVVAALLAFVAAVGAAGCLMTGMRLEADAITLVIGGALMAAVFCPCFNTRMAIWPVCLAALIIGYWWQEGTLRYSVESLIYHITNLYDQGYGWGVLQWSEWSELPTDVTEALLLVELVVVLAVGLTTVKGFVGLLGSGVAILPLIACLFLKDTVPAEGYLVLLLFAVLMILLTQGVRQRSISQANRLSAYLVLPLVVALAALMVLNPRSTYNGQEGAQKLEDFVLALFKQAEPPELFEDMTIQNGDQDKIVRLDRAGAQEQDDDLVMTVRAQESGTFYLRGCAYDIYDGITWSSTPGWNSWSLYYGTAGTTTKNLTVRTEQVHSVMYFTYAPVSGDRKVVGGRLRNDSDLTTYTVQYLEPLEYSETLDNKIDDIGGSQLAEYLVLPEDTRDRAVKFLTTKIGVPTQMNNAGQTWKNANLIAQWVSNRAKYDLNTGRMPENETDFAMWFLEKGKTGYCTHFASATVVLLRAAGIPAQYVTGYLVQVEEGEETKVTKKQAHAWVEAFINGIGWVVLEPTPGIIGSTTVTPDPSTPVTPPAGTTEPTHPQDGEDIQPTVPVETTVTTVPAEPSQGSTEATATQPGSDVQTATTAVSQMGGAEWLGGEGSTGNRAMEKPLLWLLGICLAVVLVAAQWRLRVWLRRRTMTCGDPNGRALAKWRHIERLAKLTKRQPPDRALQLAQKARFSQHTLTDAELEQLRDVLRAQTTLLKKKNFLWQPLYTLILALY